VLLQLQEPSSALQLSPSQVITAIKGVRSTTHRGLHFAQKHNIQENSDILLYSQ